MNQTLDQLARVLQEIPARLVDISEDDAARRPADGGWSRKEMLGHLIDSASNNHQRWVRALAAPQTVFPKYEQAQWVAAQNYQMERWPDLVNLWLLFNRHLLHVLRNAPAGVAAHVCTVGDKPSATVAELAESYLAHMRHHLARIAGQA